VSFSICKWINF